MGPVPATSGLCSAGKTVTRADLGHHIPQSTCRTVLLCRERAGSPNGCKPCRRALAARPDQAAEHLQSGSGWLGLWPGARVRNEVALHPGQTSPRLWGSQQVLCPRKASPRRPKCPFGKFWTSLGPSWLFGFKSARFRI